MPNQERRPILYKGESYSIPIEKRIGGGSKELPVTYEEARSALISDLRHTTERLKSLPTKFRLPHEVVFSLKMHPDFSAKSYYPDSLFDTELSKFGLKEVGSRVWKQPDSNKKNDQIRGKLFFVRSTEKALNNFEQELNKQTSRLKKSFQDDVRRISGIDLMDSSDKFFGIDKNWSEGRLEAVLHPFQIDRNLAKDHFLTLIKESGADLERVRSKTYNEGVTFISFWGNRQCIEALIDYNPLRTVHPLLVREMPGISRDLGTSTGPLPPSFTTKPTIQVGIIDGGADKDNPYLSNYLDEGEAIAGEPYEDFVSHGSRVAGTVLYGPLNKYGKSDILPEPRISVKSFRVLSKETKDPELYDVIDALETIVPSNPEISVYNLSIGPKGPIYDDNISRFTFSCDFLSHTHNVLFCVAVGNDGDIEGYNRIQSPSDGVNVLSVGAYSRPNGHEERASYSCVGPGREGGKLKPDLVAFGGCDQTPIHLLSSNLNEKVLSAGTSFASPIVAGVAGTIIGQSEEVIDSLTARALIVHSTLEKNGFGHNNELGHGILTEDINEIITCRDKSYTLIYKGEIEAGKYAQFQIPWTDSNAKGNAIFRWTSAVLTSVDPHSPDDYTASAIEVTFYPHGTKYNFSYDDGKSKKKNKVVDIVEEKDLVAQLLQEGWKQSNFPKTSSSKIPFQSEDDLRSEDLKWDSIDTREVTKRMSGVSSPFMHIHGLGRKSSSTSKIKFSVIMTVEVPSTEIDIYNEVLNTYSALIPLQIKTPVEVRVNA